MALYLNATTSQEFLNRMVDLANGKNATTGEMDKKNTVNPEVFYTKQLKDTIRIDGDQYVYYRYADETPIQNRADKLTIRRWAPLQAHTVPLEEGVPPVSDKGSVEKYEIAAHQYGRYMEMTDKVDFNVVDPVVAHYSREYSLVAMETLDMLAREVLFSVAQKKYAGGAANFEALKNDGSCKPTLDDLRVIVLAMKRALVKPRSNGRYHVIASPEFYFDMVSDPTVQKYMELNQSTYTMYDNSKLVPMFDMEFYETLVAPQSGDFYDSDGVLCKRYISNAGSLATLKSSAGTSVYNQKDEYVTDSRTGQKASFIPKHASWTLPSGGVEFKVEHVLVLGKDALTRTGLAGEGNAKMYVKPLGSSGVLDPIDQRQSIGFKINSVGFGSTRIDAIWDYVCVPTQLNA